MASNRSGQFFALHFDVTELVHSHPHRKEQHLDFGGDENGRKDRVDPPVSVRSVAQNHFLTD
jgi:hypothetical protein